MHNLHVLATTSYNGDLLEHLSSFARLGRRIRHDARSAFDEAAELLNIDASVLRRRVYLLEDWYGAELISGRGNQLALTEAGSNVVDVADRLSVDLGDLRRRLSQRTARIRIADSTEFEGSLSATIMKIRNKSLNVRISRVNRVESMLEMDRGTFDLAITCGERHPMGYQAQKVGQEEITAVFPTAHPLRSADLSRERLAERPLVMFRSPSPFRQRVLTGLEASTSRVVADGAGIFDVIELVRAGMGIGIVPRLRATRLRTVSGVVLRDISTLFKPVQCYVIWRAGRGLTRNERLLVKALSRSDSA